MAAIEESRGEFQKPRQTPKEAILLRLKADAQLYEFKSKIHDIRRLIAGDFSPIDEMSVPQDADTEAREFTAESDRGWYDILTRDFESSTTNYLQNSIRTMVLSISEHFPQIEFEGTWNNNQRMFLNKLIKMRLAGGPNGCNAHVQMQKSLLDFCSSGYMWTLHGIQKGRGTIQHADTLNVIWDQSTKDVSAHRWRAVRVSAPIATWEDTFGPSFIKKLEKVDRADHTYGLGGGDRALNKWTESVDLIWYYDVDGIDGTMAIVIAQGSQAEHLDPEAVIEYGPNPFWREIADGIREPYLPIKSSHYLQLPSTKVPMTVAESMIGSMIGMRETERTILETIQRARPWLDVPEGSYDNQDLQRMKDGETMAMLFRKKDKDPATIIGGEGIPNGLMDFVNLNKENLITQGGVDPYASGGHVKNIEFAAEVKAIQSNASLVQNALSETYGAFWVDNIRTFLDVSRVYDQAPITIWIKGPAGQEVPLSFGAQPNSLGPVGLKIPNSAEPVVMPASMQFEPQEAKVQRALRTLKVARENMDLFPMAPKLAMEQVLKAQGVKNVDEWLDIPQEMMQGGEVGDSQDDTEGAQGGG